MKTEISNKINNMDKVKKHLEIRKKVERKKINKRMLSYIDKMKNTVKIEKSKAKVNELKELIGKLKHPIRIPRDVKDEYDPIKLKIPICAHSKSTVKNITTESVSKIDYLPEVKNKLEIQRNKLLKHDGSLDFSNKKNSLETKFVKAYEKIKVFESYEKMQEDILKKVKTSKEYANTGENVTGFLINSVKMKLAILDQL